MNDVIELRSYVGRYFTTITSILTSLDCEVFADRVYEVSSSDGVPTQPNRWEYSNSIG